MKKFSIVLGLSLTISINIYASDNSGNQSSAVPKTWNSLSIKAENRCSPYNKHTDYSYSQDLEDSIVASMNGKIYGPYSGRYFVSDTMTDIEHIVTQGYIRSS